MAEFVTLFGELGAADNPLALKPLKECTKEEMKQVSGLTNRSLSSRYRTVSMYVGGGAGWASCMRRLSGSIDSIARHFLPGPT